MPLVLSEHLWRDVLDAFARQAPGLERVAFIDGFRVGDAAIATTATVPNADCHPHRYSVDADAMHEAGAHLQAFGMVRLAQVHTHGDNDLCHSRWDDARAYSQQDGAVSIVLPEHARTRPRPTDGAVHLRGPAGWRRLTPEEADAQVLLVPSMLDFRR